MPCPSCGASAPRGLIAPGFFECHALVGAVVPNPIHPRFGPGHTLVTCGTRYQDSDPQAGALGLCYVCTSILAVGLCSGCRRPVDGTHAVVTHAGLECAECRKAAAARSAAEAAEAARVAAARQAEMLAAMPIVEYLRAVLNGQVSVSDRRATGAEIADAVACPGSPSYDGRGGVSLGQPQPGVDRVLRRDGALVEVKRGSWRRPQTLNIPTHAYSAAEVTQMLREGAAYVAAIHSDNR